MIRLRLRKDEEKEIIAFSQQKSNLSHEIRIAIKILMYLKTYFQTTAPEEVFMLLRQTLPLAENAIKPHVTVSEPIINIEPEPQTELVIEVMTPQPNDEMKDEQSEVDESIAKQLLGNFF